MRGVSIRAIAGVTTGRAHRAEGSDCQDFCQVYNSDSITGACLADGAGSASYAQLGAQLACQAAGELIVDQFDRLVNDGDPERVAGIVLATVAAVIHDRAEQLQAEPNDFASTLAFAFARPTRRSVTYLCGSLGDSLVVQRSRRRLSVLLAPQNQEFANRTWFTTSKDAARRLRIVVGQTPVSQVPGWLLTSDGASSLLYSRRSQRFAPAVMSVLDDIRCERTGKAEKQVRALLEDVLLPLTHDDCSLAVIQTVAKVGHMRRTTH